MIVLHDDEGESDGERDTISVAFVDEALVGARARGLNVARLLIEAGISPHLLTLPQARVPSANYAELWRRITSVLDDEFFGMDSRPQKSGSFTLLCHAVLHSDTLERALNRALRFLRLTMDRLEGTLTREGRHARIVLHDLPYSTSPPPARAFAYGTYMLMLYGLACWLVGRRIPLLSVDFRCPEPVFSDEWRVMFSPRLNFNQTTTALHFRRFYLDLPVIRKESEMKVFLREAPSALLVKYRNSHGYATRIRHCLRALPPGNWPAFDTFAARFGMSPSTLRRRLEEEGQSYQVIRDDLRRDIAISLLLGTSLTVQSVAEETGFAENSAFHRAFKKWTGSSPSEYRPQER